MKLVYVSDYQNVFAQKSQTKNTKITILGDLGIKLSFEPS